MNQLLFYVLFFLLILCLTGVHHVRGDEKVMDEGITKYDHDILDLADVLTTVNDDVTGPVDGEFTVEEDRNIDMDEAETSVDISNSLIDDTLHNNDQELEPTYEHDTESNPSSAPAFIYEALKEPQRKRTSIPDEDWMIKFDKVGTTGINPILGPTRGTSWRCPIRKENVRWEEKDVFNPAAVVKDGKVYILYRAEDTVCQFYLL